MATRDELKRQASQIKNEVEEGRNTAKRVGGLLEEFAYSMATKTEMSDLKDKVEILTNSGYLYAGIATPTTNPGTPDSHVFYIATTVGSYSNFGNIEVSKGESAILMRNNGTWVKNTFKPMTDFNSVFDGESGETLTKTLKTFKAKVYGTTVYIINKQITVTSGEKVYISLKNNSEKNFTIWVGAFDGDVVKEYLTSTHFGDLAIVVKAGETIYFSAVIPDGCNNIRYGTDGVNNPSGTEFEMSVLGYNTLIEVNTQAIETETARAKAAEEANAQTIEYVVPPSIKGIRDSIVIGGNLEGENNLNIKTTNICDVNNEYLQKDKISKLFCSDYRSTENQFNFGIFVTDTIGAIMKANKSKFTRLEVYLYCAEGKNNISNVHFYTGAGQESGTYRVSFKKINDTLSKHVFVQDNSVLDDSHYVYISCNINTLTEKIEKGDFGLTGFKIALFDTLDEAKNTNIKGDWASIDYITKDATSKLIDEKINIDKYGETGKIYNNVKENADYVEMFTKMLADKFVNRENRLLVSFNGDSILGSQLEDVEKGEGYDTGEFPPNMSKNIVARLFFDRYRFADEDVIFRNLTNSDWNKVGFDIPNGFEDKNKSFNCMETFACNEGDYAEIEISNKKFVKFVWSEYTSDPTGFNIIQTLEGETKTLAQITTSRRGTCVYKIFNLNETKTYKFKIVPTLRPTQIRFWGIEAWTNPRLDVFVGAVSGSTAKMNVDSYLDSWYGDYHKPVMCISDLLIINDNSYMVYSDYTVEGWRKDNATLFKHLIDNGVIHLTFINHGYGAGKLKNYALGMAKYNNLHYIDIQQKMLIDKPTFQIVNFTDGVHLSTYGNKYFFEELIKIFG